MNNISNINFIYAIISVILKKCVVLCKRKSAEQISQYRL